MSKTTPKSTGANFIPKSVVRRIVAARRHVLLVCVWLFWLLLLGGAVLVAHLWTERYDYLEQSAKQILAERNIRGDLDIISINRSSLRIENIELREIDAPDEPAFFSADIVEAHYVWQDLFKGKIDGLIVTRPKAVVEIDASGSIIAGWVPPTQTGDGSDFVFPKDGFTVKDGQLTVISPYGEVSSSVNAVILGRSQFDVDLDITPTQLAHNDISSVVGGLVSVQAEKEHYAVEADLNLTTLVRGAVEAGRADIKGKLSVRQDEGQWEINGPMSVALEDVVSANTSVSNLSIASVGDIKVPTLAGEKNSIMAELSYRGDVDITAQNLSAFDGPTRADLANTLSFHDILQGSPILRDFAPTLKSQVEQVISDTDIAAKLTITKQGEALKILAREDVLITRDGTPWQIKPSASAPLIDIRPQHEGSIPYRGVSHFSFVKPAPLPVVLSQGSMQFGLTSPTAFAGVTAFDGRVHFPQNWTMADLGGQPTSLSLQRADLSFERASETSQFAAKTDFNITGKVPGGYVTELGGSGYVVIDQNIESSQLQFSSQESLSYRRVDLTSGWILEDGTLFLAAPVLMTGPPQRRRVEVGLKDVTTRIHDDDVRDFQADIKAIDGTGLLQLNAEGPTQGLTQDWTLHVTDGHMTSAEFPIENTDIFSPKAVIKTKLVEGHAPLFDIDSPALSVSSDLVSADEITVHMSGTPDNLTVDYDAKLFRFADPSLPQIPMVGQTRLIGTQWQGESVARLPQDPDTPIDISFIFEDGEGEADVNIQTLSFTEKGLQPQNLVRNLQGKIGAVNGSVSTAIKLEFGEGKDLKSYGTASFDDLDFGILPGTVQGLNGELEFTSFFPLETSGRQTLKLRSFDPGFPLPDGEIEFELLPGKINIHRAEWIIDDGSIYIEPLIWDFSATENRAVLAVKDVTIQNFIERPSDSKFEITGAISGRLPLVVSGVQVNVEEGVLSVPNGGHIRFNHSSTDLAGAQNQAVGVAFDALKDFEYDIFELNVNGPLDGLIRLRTVFTGSNDDVYAGQPFEFDVEIEGELMNLMRNLDPERILGEEYYDLAVKERAEPSHNHAGE